MSQPDPSLFDINRGFWDAQNFDLPQGRQAAGTPLKNRVPRTPLGPSESRIDGTLSRCTGAVCQKSMPDNSETFSAMFS
jgi:hypothetical protein